MRISEFNETMPGFEAETHYFDVSVVTASAQKPSLCSHLLWTRSIKTETYVLPRSSDDVVRSSENTAGSQLLPIQVEKTVLIEATTYM
jgi:hypothetical protein